MTQPIATMLVCEEKQDVWARATWFLYHDDPGLLRICIFNVKESRVVRQGEYSNIMTTSHDDHIGPGTLTRGPTTLWFQIAQRLRQVIADGHLKPGDQLPTELELMERFSVGRSTVRAAMGALEVEGLIWRGQGRGSFVAEKAEQTVTFLTGYHEDTMARGYTPSAKTLRIEQVIPSSLVAARLGLDPGVKVIFFERILLADGEPIGLQRSSMPEWVLGDGELFTEAELSSGSVYQMLGERAEAAPQWATQVVEAVLAGNTIADILGVPDGSPILKLERLCYDGYDRPVSLGDFWYRADRYRLSVQMLAQNMPDRPGGSTAPR